MKLSVYRPRKARSETDHTSAIKGATTDSDVELVMLAVNTGKPTLIGLDGQSTIVKTFEEGDEAHTFEGLYDNCLTLFDLQQMQRAGVDSPEKVPPSQYRCELAFRFQGIVDIPIVITATNHGDVRTQLRELVDGDADFREHLVDAFVAGMRQQSIDELIWTIRDTQQVEPVNPPERVWSFIEEE